MNKNFINTWVANADLGRSGSLQEPIAMRRKRDGITFNTNNPLVRAIMKGWAKGSPVDTIVVSPDFELMGSLDYNEFLDNLGRMHDVDGYQMFLNEALEGKRPGLGDIILTPEQPSQEVIDTFHTPKMAHEDYTVIGIDTIAFPNGGTLSIDFKVGRDDAIGLFFLLDGDKKIPTEKVSEGIEPAVWHNQDSDEFKDALNPLAQAWGIFPKQTGQLKYEFDRGQRFKLCVTGDQWGGVGGINAFVANINVTKKTTSKSESAEPENLEETLTPVSSEINVMLDKSQPSQEVIDIFRAPGNEKQDYTVVNIDTTAFHQGGLLTIDIRIGSAETYGSIDLFDKDTELPTEGIPKDALESAWGIEPGTSDTINYRFEKGRQFKLGITGDWDSDKGAINAFQAKISVEEN